MQQLQLISMAFLAPIIDHIPWPKEGKETLEIKVRKGLIFPQPTDGTKTQLQNVQCVIHCALPPHFERKGVGRGLISWFL